MKNFSDKRFVKEAGEKMKKQLLFVIDSLMCGGAEKSLVTLLNIIDYSKVDVDLMMFRHGGAFEDLVPDTVHIVSAPHHFEQLQASETPRMKDFYFRIKTSFLLRMNRLSKEKYYTEQIVYRSLKPYLEICDKQYDCAIAYSQGMPTYYVSNHVMSKKKLAWINCNYVTTEYNKQYDTLCYQKMNHIVVVSDFIKETLKEYPWYKKVEVVNDIVDPRMIQHLSNRDSEYANDMEYRGIKLLTVARLEKVKGFDLLVKAASILKKEGLDFKWFIIGEGSERGRINVLCKEYHLEDSIILLGQKTNPYVYMKRCDIYVQTSRNEGLGLTVIEAKILEKLIVCTNFSTASSLISDKLDGILCDILFEDIAEKIMMLVERKELRENILGKLRTQKKFNTVGEINKIYNLVS